MPSIEYRPDRPKAVAAPDLLGTGWPAAQPQLRPRGRTRKRWLTSEEAVQAAAAPGPIPARGARRRFNDWADRVVGGVGVGASGAARRRLEAAESHLRLHIRSHFGARPASNDHRPRWCSRWQNELDRQGELQPHHGLPVAPEPRSWRPPRAIS